MILETKQAKNAISILERSYPKASYYLDFDTPIHLLVLAILSAQTRDEVVNSLSNDLFSKYKSAKDFANADEEELCGLIKKVSFAQKKARSIISACSIISERYGGTVPNTMDELISLPGIGRKTANTILINAFGIVEGIPVDAWVIRLSLRIGLTASRDPEVIEKDLESKVEKRYWHNIAYVMKAHGKKVCKSGMPLCSKCQLKDICPKNGVSKSR
ncbi:endonuclease III [Candidatus Marsarchaeota archaeon]|nr:endonuclease III [Candidatus Marsarchaeota archaeon]